MIKFKTIATYVIVFIVAVAIQLPQIYSHAIILGNDSLFHMNRFFDAMMQIKEHSIGNTTMDLRFWANRTDYQCGIWACCCASEWLYPVSAGIMV
ncbi:hypothetical protein EFM35_06000 [Weissella cibaria]|nr:hypothetical protein [Weissella cibaria]